VIKVHRDAGLPSLPVRCPAKRHKWTGLMKNAVELLAKSGSLCYNFPNRRIG
jgi:hypothetical protein